MTREGVELVEGWIRGIPLYDGDVEQEEGGSRRGQKVLFRLASRRAAGDRLILDEAEAQRAFAREVAACLVDPHIRAWRNAGSFGIETAHPSVEQASS